MRFTSSMHRKESAMVSAFFFFAAPGLHFCGPNNKAFNLKLFFFFKP